MRLAVWGGLATVMLGAMASGAYADNGYCREFQRAITIGGERQNSYGTACQQPDGAWKIVSESDNAFMAAVEPAAEPVYVQQQVVYQEPLYVERQVAYAPFYTPAWGLNLDWSNHGRGHGRGGDWHGGRGHGHGRH